VRGCVRCGECSGGSGLRAEDAYTGDSVRETCTDVHSDEKCEKRAVASTSPDENQQSCDKNIPTNFTAFRNPSKPVRVITEKDSIMNLL